MIAFHSRLFQIGEITSQTKKHQLAFIQTSLGCWELTGKTMPFRKYLISRYILNRISSQRMRGTHGIHLQVVGVDNMKVSANSISYCVAFKCNTCKKKETCNRESLETYTEPLTYKPFEKLGELLNNDKSRDD